MDLPALHILGRRWGLDLGCSYCRADKVQLTEMSGTSNSGSFVCLLWKGWLNGSLVTNSTWKLTSIYSHFLSIVLHSCLSTKFVSRVCPFQSWIPLDFQQSAATNTPSIPSKQQVQSTCTSLLSFFDIHRKEEKEVTAQVWFKCNAQAISRRTYLSTHPGKNTEHLSLETVPLS